MKFDIADLAADRRNFHTARSLTFDAFVHLKGIAGENELAVRTPVGPGIRYPADDDVMCFFCKVFQAKTLDCRGIGGSRHQEHGQ